MKKAIVLILAAAMIVGALTSCGTGKEDQFVSKAQKLIGTWSEFIDDRIYIEVTFGSDKNMTLVRGTSLDDLSEYGYTYSVEDDTIVFYSDGEVDFTWQFSFEGSTLVVFDESDDENRFTKGAHREWLDENEPEPEPKPEKKTEEKTEEKKDSGSDGATVSPVCLFSTKTGISPTSTTGSLTKPGEMYTEIYNLNVTLSQIKSYSEYVESCGYTHNKQDEQEYKDTFDFVSSFKTGVKNQGIVMSYSGGIGIISYGSACEITDDPEPDPDPDPYPYPDPTPYPVTYKCQRCGGTGKTVCSVCGGTGKIITYERGPDYGYGSKSYEVSRDCGCDNGYNPCYYCGGDGKIER